jgi:hypothetical protein
VPSLTETFTSDIQGISISYPAGWETRPATEAWTSTGWPDFQDTFGDFMYDPNLDDHLFLGMASQPLQGQSADRWTTDILAQEECDDAAADDPIVVDDAPGVLVEECRAALVSIGDRGYWVTLYASADSPALDNALKATFDRAWFEQVLATVQLLPEDAVDPIASASPSVSPSPEGSPST